MTLAVPQAVMPPEYEEALADLTFFMGWSPDIVERMTLTEVRRWNQHAARIKTHTGRKT